MRAFRREHILTTMEDLMSLAAPQPSSKRIERSALLSGIPSAQGLYDPRAERDACGVAFEKASE